MSLKIGPAGLGGVKEAVENIKTLAKNGLKVCEIAFTRGVYIKPEQAGEIARAAKENGIELTIHSQYWVNLNSAEKKKIEESKKRILDCCRIGEMLGATKVVFHPGYYGKMQKEETYENIKKAVLEIMEEIKKQKWKIKIAAETMGKVNVFGSAEDILKLSEETGCNVCLDFAHLKARSNGKLSYSEVFEMFKNIKELHCHFSGIEYSDKGERHHKVTPGEEIKKLAEVFKKNANLIGKMKVTVVNESPTPFEDSLSLLKEMNTQNPKK